MLVTLLMTAVPRLLTSLTNRFNVINISLLAIGIHIGLCSSVIRPWASALISIQRRFTIRGSVGKLLKHLTSSLEFPLYHQGTAVLIYQSKIWRHGIGRIKKLTFVLSLDWFVWFYSQICGFGFGGLDFGFWILDFGVWSLDFGFFVFGVWISESEVLNLGFWIWVRWLVAVVVVVVRKIPDLLVVLKLCLKNSFNS